MAVSDVGEWLTGQIAPERLVYGMRLPVYDNIKHIDGMRGLFMPRQVVFRVVPSLIWSEERNPSAPIEMEIDSHPFTQTVRAVWHNSRMFRGMRNETRLTGIDEDSVLADPDSAGALAMFSFPRDAAFSIFTTPKCRVWMCETAAEEDVVEDRLGPVDPQFGGALWPDFFERLDWPSLAYG
ncbi:MAG: hypothetical protein OXC56_02670 [Chloroflexi bacterium]|nr:hypothetical protein [Chloroflexota bacterium]